MPGPWPPSAVMRELAPLPGSERFDAAVLSPLRYPGAKRNLLPAIQRYASHQRVQLFVEPMAGGAGTTLRLLGTGAAEHAIVADADPLVAAFWWAAAFLTDDLIEAVHQETVSLGRWDYWRAARPVDLLDRAMKALFLNRTSFSGILQEGAGPIGGRSQSGQYRIDCRWNPTMLSKRIRAAGDLAASGRLLDVWCAPWELTLKRLDDEYVPLLDDPGYMLVYFDPPYVDKGSRLYPNPFSPEDHQDLASYLTGPNAPARWALSYDDHPLVRQLYRSLPMDEHQLAYSTTGRRSAVIRKTELLILSSGQPA